MNGNVERIFEVVGEADWFGRVAVPRLGRRRAFAYAWNGLYHAYEHHAMDPRDPTSRLKGRRVLQGDVDQESVAAAVLKPHCALFLQLHLLSLGLLGAKCLWETRVGTLGSWVPFVFFGGAC